MQNSVFYSWCFCIDILAPCGAMFGKIAYIDLCEYFDVTLSHSAFPYPLISDSLFLSMLSRASGEINNVISVVVSLHSFCLSPSSNFRNIDRHEGLLKNVTCLWPMLWITAPPNFGCYINATVLSSLNIDLVITRLVGTSKIPFFREVGAFHVIEVFSGIFIGFFFFFSPAYSIYSILLVHLIVHTGRISLKHKFNIPDISS